MRVDHHLVAANDSASSSSCYAEAACMMQTLFHYFHDRRQSRNLSRDCVRKLHNNIYVETLSKLYKGFYNISK